MIRHILVIVLFSITFKSTGQAQDLVNWGTSGDWEIVVDTAAGNGCLMQKRFSDGTLVQFGDVPNRNGGFIAAYNAEWTDIKDGAVGKVTLEFPDVRFVGDVVGVAKEGRFGGYAFFDNPNVAPEFARNNDMRIIGELGRKIEVSLSGTSKAIKAIKVCQSEQSE